MKEIKSKNVQSYVMDDMAWKVDLPTFWAYVPKNCVNEAELLNGKE